jgi:WD40 repeat protein
VTTINGHEGAVRSLSQTKDGLLISGSEDKTIKIWDKSWNCKLTLEGSDDYIRVVKALSTGRIASGSRDNSLKIWNTETKSIV